MFETLQVRWAGSFNHLPWPSKPAGSAEIAGLGSSGETIDIGSDLGLPVTSSYASPFAFTGETTWYQPHVDSARLYSL